MGRYSDLGEPAFDAQFQWRICVDCGAEFVWTHDESGEQEQATD